MWAKVTMIKMAKAKRVFIFFLPFFADDIEQRKRYATVLVQKKHFWNNQHFGGFI
jgi:hypothetical protein